MTSKRAFTLVELLVVISIVSLLVTILMPSLIRAKQLSRETVCLTRLAGLIKAVWIYAEDNHNRIPIGPDVPMNTTYAVPGMPSEPCNTFATNRLWIGMLKTYDGAGALLEAEMPFEKGFYCPGDGSNDPIDELPKLRDRYRVGEEDAHCSYLYRQLDDARGGLLDGMGKNGEGHRASALLMDMNSEMPGQKRLNHGGRKVNVAFVDGGCTSNDNSDDDYTLREEDVANPFGRIDEILRYADSHH